MRRLYVGEIRWRMNLEADDVGIERLEEFTEGTVLGNARPQAVNVIRCYLHSSLESV